MGYHSTVVGVLALVALASASVGDNTIDSGERVVLVSPVLAPPQDTKVHSSIRARQFPILVLLARGNPGYSRELQAKSLERSSQPVYVQKLEDQPQPAAEAPRQLNRQKRHLKKHYSHGGGGGGCYSCGQPVYVQQPVYHQPRPVYVTVVKGYGGHGGGGGYGHGGGYGGSPCGGGGCGGGGGYGGGFSSATATATATANAYSGGYGKK